MEGLYSILKGVTFVADLLHRRFLVINYSIKNCILSNFNHEARQKERGKEVDKKRIDSKVFDAGFGRVSDRDRG